ncbi:hypothetical protein K488DRAFT_90338 [Vararia minispora EC-137]|uniref:Uncharacterized protein n=1 Tax=Vararia minispora EC-137 TaxID=1314806 RepID=A0ACB8Q838_9AGAM|nr:hypothetical protein K488DRAFT_90338 [Vararia minispora EC-137]
MPDAFSFDLFANLDGLIRLFSFRSVRFVLLSSITTDEWMLRLGTVGEGTWWEGTWSEEDVLAIADGRGRSTGVRSGPLHQGHYTSRKHLKSFAQRLESTIVSGDLGLAGWDTSSASTDAELVLDPKATRPLRVPLRAMSPKEAARFAAEHLASIAKQVQPHGCRLFTSSPPASLPASSSSSKRPQLPSPPPPPRDRSPPSSPVRTDVDSSPPAKRQRIAREPTQPADPAARAEIEQLRRELTQARMREERKEREHRERERFLLAERSAGGSTDLLRSRSVVPAVTRRPGASLANPSQKARRYQAQQFADDSD